MTGRYGTIAGGVQWTVAALKLPRNGVTYHREVISTDAGPPR
ncbi:hypothetical protein [Nocardia arthritidis]|nr:hypothetical protein [Nocardia arthritidis]